ncbi:MAG TPA: hypothetical protein VGQ10_20395 [Vicinamibacterales bacterium]|nr:hypothetical protein [Vicinamibacterales bacterium]
MPQRESDRLRWRATLASTLAYIVLTAVQGRHVLGSLGSGVVQYPVDSLLNAAILAWNARHVPFTDAWWQFPMFYPTADTLAFSEHLLGVSVVSTPLYWTATRSPPTTSRCCSPTRSAHWGCTHSCTV